MAGRVENLDPHTINPPHEQRSEKLLAELVEDMKENGWQGRPLLVIQTASGFQAWTGSHRIAAARDAELKLIPCYIMSEQSLTRVGAEVLWGHVEDHERHRILCKVGDEEAIRLMWLENRPC